MLLILCTTVMFLSETWCETVWTATTLSVRVVRVFNARTTSFNMSLMLLFSRSDLMPHTSECLLSPARLRWHSPPVSGKCQYRLDRSVIRCLKTDLMLLLTCHKKSHVVLLFPVPLSLKRLLLNLNKWMALKTHLSQV